MRGKKELAEVEQRWRRVESCRTTGPSGGAVFRSWGQEVSCSTEAGGNWGKALLVVKGPC